MLTEDAQHSIADQAITVTIMLAVVAFTYVLMLLAGSILRVIGNGGASIVSRVMGMILASIAATQVLEGLRDYFS